MIKKTYEIPSVEMTQLAMGSIICASVTEGAGGTAANGNGSGGDTIGD